MKSRIVTCLTGTAAVAVMSEGTGAAEREWLSLGSKHLAAAEITQCGIGTARSSAEAKVTREEIEGWCESS